MAFSIRDLIRTREAFDQKFNGLTYLIKGLVLILISLFLYYQLANGLKADYIVYTMILATLVSSYKEIWELVKSLYRGLVVSRADILVQINNEKWEQIEARKSEYTSTMTDKAPEYLHRKDPKPTDSW